MKCSVFLVTLALACTLPATALLAQQPKVTNAQFHSEPVSAGLSASIEKLDSSTALLWAGYEVQALSRTHLSACWSQSGDECCNEFRLEDTAGDVNISDRPDAQSPTAYVLLRVDHGAVTRVRSAPAGCTLNAGGLRLEWLTDVKPEDSVVFLAALASKHGDDSDNRDLDGSLAALAMHATPKATEVLASLADPSHPEHLREKAAFWLGAQRGHEGLLALQKLVAKEPDAGLRRKLAFDLSVNSDPAATDELIRMAKSDPEGGVRGQAIFWLAQKAGKKAIAAMQDAMENDPDFEVKKKAVFALSQLPKDESVTQLMHVADTNQNPKIRKEAIFWLGQTNDPRALAYLEDILKR